MDLELPDVAVFPILSQVVPPIGEDTDNVILPKRKLMRMKTLKK